MRNIERFNRSRSRSTCWACRSSFLAFLYPSLLFCFTGGERSTHTTTARSLHVKSSVPYARDEEGHDAGPGEALVFNEDRFVWDHEWTRQQVAQRVLGNDYIAHDPSTDTSARRTAHISHKIEEIPQCRVLGPKLNAYLASYIDRYYFYSSENQRKSHSTLTYSCESNKKGHFCGGMGDRFRGMISTLYLALLTNRSFSLYHPRPVPIQLHLNPNLINFIPFVSSPRESQRKKTVFGGARAPVELDEVEREVTSVPVDLQLMSLKKHRKYVQYLASAAGRAKKDIRIQCNSFGVDPFVHAVPELGRVKSVEMGLKKDCNISCYFGCLYHVLFRPSTTLSALAESTLDGISAVEAVTQIRARKGGMLEKEVERSPKNKVTRSFLIAMQVRVGGPWASRLAIPEPFRTPPAAVPHFFALVEEALNLLSAVLPTSDEDPSASLTGAVRDASRAAAKALALFPRAHRLAEGPSGTSLSKDDLPRVLLFVSSDAPLFVNKTREAFSVVVKKVHPFLHLEVRWVDGDSFTHTDSGDLSAIRPDKFTAVPSAVKETQYLLTLLNHFLISRADHVVMAQSGFGDTAFWASRSSASCIFVDMTNLRWAWQHHLGYPDEAGSATAVQSRILDLSASPSRFY
jgi:hypothetical protein